jgi:hypothetical protein
MRQSSFDRMICAKLTVSSAMVKSEQAGSHSIDFYDRPERIFR